MYGNWEVTPGPEIQRKKRDVSISQTQEVMFMGKVAKITENIQRVTVENVVREKIVKLDEYFDTQEGTKTCTVCRRHADKKCSQCSTYYCSRSCQVEDWPEHSNVCTFWAEEGQINEVPTPSKKGPLCITYDADTEPDTSSSESGRFPSFKKKNLLFKPPVPKSDPQPSPRPRPVKNSSKLVEISDSDTDSEEQNDLLAEDRNHWRHCQQERADKKSSQLQNRQKYAGESEKVDAACEKTIKMDPLKRSEVISLGKEANNIYAREPEKVDAACKKTKKIDPPKRSRVISLGKEANEIYAREPEKVDAACKKTRKIDPPERSRVISLGKEAGDIYRVVEHNFYPLWKEMKHQLAVCSKNSCLPPRLYETGACFVNNNWYRGRVISLRPQVKVELIDFGNVCNYDGEIRDIFEDFKNVQPLTYLIKFAEEVPKLNKGDAIDIEIYEKTNENISICRLLTDVSTRLQPKPVKIVYKNTELPNNSKPEGRKEDITAPPPPPPPPTSLIFLEKNLQVVILNPGEVKNLMVTHIDEEFYESGTFYMADPENDFFKAVIRDYPEKILEYVSQNTNSYSPQEGELILAKFEGQWYRAVNVEKLPDGRYRVYFVDYGNESVCDISSIRKIRRDFTGAPCQAIKCILKGNEQITKNSNLQEDIFSYIESNIGIVLQSVEVIRVIKGRVRLALTNVSLPEVEKAMN